jgi:CubicO group peptidase (beta-lactamase class C family)
MSTTPIGRRAAFAGAAAGLAATALPAAAQPNGHSRPSAAPALIRGFARDRLARIGPAMQAEAERGSFPGAVTLIARQGEIVHFEAHGHQDAAKTKRIPRDAIFLQASMTKPLVSTLAMMLVEEGRIKLDDPIAAYLPELRDLKVEVTQNGQTETVAATRQPTVHDLLRHTAGFAYSGTSPSPRIKSLYEEGNIEAGQGRSPPTRCCSAWAPSRWPSSPAPPSSTPSRSTCWGCWCSASRPSGSTWCWRSGC